MRFEGAATRNPLREKTIGPSSPMITSSDIVEIARTFRMRALITVFIMAVLLNYLWELAQAPLYVGMEDYHAGVFRHCFVASLGDGIIVLLIVVAGWITLRRWDWFEQADVLGYVVMVTAGLVMAVLIEWLGVHVLKRWEYTGKMPTAPGLGIGLVPIAQMLFLPPLIFRIVAVLDQGKT